jgi:hypothetical protein
VHNVGFTVLIVTLCNFANSTKTFAAALIIYDRHPEIRKELVEILAVTVVGCATVRRNIDAF